MNNKRKKLEEKIRKYSVSMESVFKDFTEEENKIVDVTIRYYDVLVSLKKLRKESKLTQEGLAKKADLPRTTITKIESGAYNPTISTLMSIASAMNKKLEVKFV